MVVATAVGVAVIVSMAVACGWFAVAVIVIVSTTMAGGWLALVCLNMTVIVTMLMLMLMLVLVVVAIVAIVITVAGVVMVLAHASLPVEGSAICSSISLRTSLIWASAAE